MRVFVTHEQFAAISDAKMRVDVTHAPADMDTLIGMLAACCLDNGGDYDPALHRAGAPTELVIISGQKSHGKVSQTVSRSLTAPKKNKPERR